MDVCKVVGQAVSTAKDDGLHGTKLMIVRPADAQGNATGGLRRPARRRGRTSSCSSRGLGGPDDPAA
jgi:hypothetical protein